VRSRLCCQPQRAGSKRHLASFKASGRLAFTSSGPALARPAPDCAVGHLSFHHRPLLSSWLLSGALGDSIKRTDLRFGLSPRSLTNWALARPVCLAVPLPVCLAVPVPMPLSRARALPLPSPNPRRHWRRRPHFTPHRRCALDRSALPLQRERFFFGPSCNAPTRQLHILPEDVSACLPGFNDERQRVMDSASQNGPAQSVTTGSNSVESRNHGWVVGVHRLPPLHCLL